MPHPYWFILGMFAFWSVFLTIIFRLEKKLVWPYSALESAPYFGDPSGFGARSVADATRNGFVFLGWARDIKGPTYRVSYAMLVSPNRDTFAVVGLGAVMRIKVEAIWLYTPTADGRCCYSTTHQTGVQLDVSGNWRNQLVPTSRFDELVQRHEGWIREMGIVPRPFTPGRECEEYRALRQEHFRSMERAGLIAFTDASAMQFQFTFSGAAKTATWGYFLGMARSLSHGRFPRTA